MQIKSVVGWEIMNGDHEYDEVEVVLMREKLLIFGYESKPCDDDGDVEIPFPLKELKTTSQAHDFPITWHIMGCVLG